MFANVVLRAETRLPDMSFPVDEPVDLLEELKLRRWAREHYVAAVHRDAAWHPVILDEMARKQADLERNVVLPSRGPFAAVPLPPGPSPDQPIRVLHGAHEESRKTLQAPHVHQTVSGPTFDPSAAMQFIVSSVAVSPARRAVR